MRVGVHDEPVMTLQFAIGAVDGGIVEVGPDDAGLEVVQKYGLGDSPKELEGAHMAVDPGRRVLVLDEAHEAVTAVRERHHEGPEKAPFALEAQLGSTEVHLRLAPWRRLQTDRDPGRGWLEVAVHEAFDAGVAYGHATLAQESPDLFDGHVLFAEPQTDQLGVRLQELLGGRGLIGLRPHELGVDRGSGPVALSLVAAHREPYLDALSQVFAHGVSSLPKRTGDLRDVLTLLETEENLVELDHRDGPPGHVVSCRNW